MEKNNQLPILIAVDQGYGQIKTPNVVFPTGITQCMGEPSFAENVLEWAGRKYLIGVGHKPFMADKTRDEDFRLLTMAAMARELALRGSNTANVILAVGLPLDWAGEQKQRFHDYMLKLRNLAYSYNNEDYEVYIRDVMIYPQGFAAVADRLNSFKGMNMLADIGNGTLSMMFIHSGRPVANQVYTETFGVYQCVLQMKNTARKQFRAELDEVLIDEYIRTGDVELPMTVKTMMRNTAENYVKQIMQSVRDHGFDPQMMKLHIMGGGVWLIERFCDDDARRAMSNGRIILNKDIHATAKGFETMARNQLTAKGMLLG